MNMGNFPMAQEQKQRWLEFPCSKYGTKEDLRTGQY